LPRDAARCAAAGVERRAVGVPERDAGCCVVAVRHDRELIEADAALAVAHAPREVAIDRVRVILTAQVDDREVVAVRVHLPKSDWHGGSCIEAGDHCTVRAGRDQCRSGTAGRSAGRFDPPDARRAARLTITSLRRRPDASRAARGTPRFRMKS
jgi:hypothetical protein